MFYIAYNPHALPADTQSVVYVTLFSSGSSDVNYLNYKID